MGGHVSRSSSGIEFRVKVSGWQQLVSAMTEGRKAVNELGDAGLATGDKLKVSGRGYSLLASNAKAATTATKDSESSLRRMIGTLGGLGAAWTGFEGIKSAINDTKEWTEESLQLTTALGLTAKQAGQWAAVAQARGISSSRLTSTFGLLSKAAVNAEKGGNQQARAFQLLGITQKDLVSSSSNITPLVLKLAGAFDHMQGGTTKAAIASTLFGRSWQQILPLFREGNESLATNLKWAKEYFPQLGINGVAQLKNLVVAQDQASYATKGLGVAFGSDLAPTLIGALNAWPKLVLAIKQGRGPWGAIKTVIGDVAGLLKTVAQWFEKNKSAAQVLKLVLLGLSGAWGAEKVLKFTKAIRDLETVKAAAKGVSIAKKIFTFGKDAEPFVTGAGGGAAGAKAVARAAAGASGAGAGAGAAAQSAASGAGAGAGAAAQSAASGATAATRAAAQAAAKATPFYGSGSSAADEAWSKIAPALASRLPLGARFLSIAAKGARFAGPAAQVAVALGFPASAGESQSPATQARYGAHGMGQNDFLRYIASHPRLATLGELEFIGQTEGVGALRQLMAYQRQLTQSGWFKTPAGMAAAGVPSPSWQPPGLWAGGDVWSGGPVRVGEHGPETLTLPRGARVSPLNGGDSAGMLRALSQLPKLIARELAKVQQPVVLSSDALATGVYQDTTLRAARR